MAMAQSPAGACNSRGCCMTNLSRGSQATFEAGAHRPCCLGLPKSAPGYCSPPWWWSGAEVWQPWSRLREGQKPSSQSCGAMEQAACPCCVSMRLRQLERQRRQGVQAADLLPADCRQRELQHLPRPASVERPARRGVRTRDLFRTHPTNQGARATARGQLPPHPSRGGKRRPAREGSPGSPGCLSKRSTLFECAGALPQTCWASLPGWSGLGLLWWQKQSQSQPQRAPTTKPGPPAPLTELKLTLSLVRQDDGAHDNKPQRLIQPPTEN